MTSPKKKLLLLAFFFVSPFLLLLIVLSALLSRLIDRKTREPRLVWGSVPIINYAYWSQAMRARGYASETFTTDYYSNINDRQDWDRILAEEYPIVPAVMKPFAAFVRSLFCYDVFFVSFEGYFLGTTPLWWIQAAALKLARKKIVVMPYGGDGYVYRNVHSSSLLHGLLMSYPDAAKKQDQIARRVRYWCRHADVVIPGFMGPDGIGRWDVLVPSSLHLDLSTWRASKRNSRADGVSDCVNIAHSPNHRGFKGTEFLMHAVDQLQSRGVKVKLLLLENVQNSEVRRILAEEVDILVEQLIVTGHGMSGLEGMASGLPVVSNLEDETYTRLFRRWSFFDECPIVSASPETLMSVLEKLIARPDLRFKLGQAGRDYVEKYHGLDGAQFLFGEIIKFLYGRRECLINLYHPLIGQYSSHSPKVEHPLVDSRIPD